MALGLYMGADDALDASCGRLLLHHKMWYTIAVINSVSGKSLLVSI